MAKQNRNQHAQPDIIDAEYTTIDSGGALVPQPRTVNLRPRNTPRSNLQDGGYFDASGKRRPIFMVLPSEDNMAALMAIRAWLRALLNLGMNQAGMGTSPNLR